MEKKELKDMFKHQIIILIGACREQVLCSHHHDTEKEVAFWTKIQSSLQAVFDEVVNEQLGD